MSAETLNGRKTFPRNRNNRGEVHYRPDVPVVQAERVGRGKLDIFVPKRARATSTGLYEMKSWAKTALKDGSTTGKVLTPVTKMPLTPVFETSHGGKRVGGGGTSREALRRAKRKAKRAGKRS